MAAPISRIAEPSATLLHRLAVTGEDEILLSDDEATGVFAVLLFAGHDSVQQMVGYCLYALLAHPGQAAALRSDPGRIDGAVEEMLRYLPLNQFGVPRVCVEDVVTGHSIGEAAAAYTAGMFSLADVTALITIRGTALRSAPPGAMLALQAGEPEVRDFLAHTGAALDVAAVNGPAAVVVSGAPDAVAGFASAWTASGLKCRQLKVGRAFHSRHVEGVLGDFRTVLESLTFRTPDLPIVSTVTGRLIDPAEMGTPEYWLRQVRQPVRFQNALGELAGQGVGAFLEVGPSGTLASAGMECLDASFHALLRPRSAEDTGVLTALAELYAGGTAVDWATVLAGGRPVDLPVYPFQHQSYWLMSAAPEPTVAPAEPAEPDVPDEPRTVLERPAPVRLFASGRRAPSRYRTERIHEGTDAQVVAELKLLGGPNPALLADPEMRELILPAVRSDYTAIERYRHDPGRTLTCPITALIGDRDPRVSPDEAQSWADHTTGPFTLKTFPGDHFYLVPRASELIAFISRTLTAQAPRT